MSNVLTVQEVQESDQTSCPPVDEPLPTAVSDSISRADISALAYTYWEAQGRPEGCDLMYWLQAEKDLAAVMTSEPGITHLERSDSKP